MPGVHVVYTVRHWVVRGAFDCLFIEYPVHVLCTVQTLMVYQYTV